MKLYIKRSLILASVVITTHLMVVHPSMAQSNPAVIESEEVIAADPLDSLPSDAQLATPSYGAGFIPYISEELIEDRLNCLQNEINLEYNSTIQSFIEFFVVRKREYTKMVLGRKDLYFPIFEEYLKKYNLPEELKYLSVVESGLNPRIVSRAKAGGLWQFMPGTGRDFRLYQDNFVDERFDPYKSTEAACKYLKQLYNLFGDWELALASYNCGPGNVRRAIRRSGNRTSFWEIYNNLPRETRSYVPQFVALTYVLNYSEDYKLQADSLERIIPFDTIQVSQHVNLEALAKQLEVPLGDLQHLNPHLKKNLVPPYLKNYPIRIPAEKREMFAANRLAIMDSVSKAAFPESSFLVMNVGYIKKKMVHKVQKGESLARIADKFNVSSYQVKTWNHLRSNKVRSGQRLTIWVEKPIPMNKPEKVISQQAVATSANAEKQSAVSAEATVENNKNMLAEQSSSPTAKKVIHTVRKGEALGAIANKYHVSLSELKTWNHLEGNKVRIGQRLSILKEQTVTDAPQKDAPSAVVASAKDEDEYPTVEAVTAGDASDTEKAQPTENKVVHTVLKGESLFRIADKYHVKVAQIKEWNHLEKDNVQSNQQLTIWLGETGADPAVSKEEDAQAALATSSAKVNEQKVKVPEKQLAESKQIVEKQVVHPASASTKVHWVQKGDTLWSISKQYGNIPVEQIKKLNKLKGNELRPGQKLILS